jgi:hypothetical protein
MGAVLPPLGENDGLLLPGFGLLLLLLLLLLLTGRIRREDLLPIRLPPPCGKSDRGGRDSPSPFLERGDVRRAGVAISNPWKFSGTVPAWHVQRKWIKLPSRVRSKSL